MILLASMCGLRVVPRDTPYTVPEFSLAAADDPFHIVVPCSFRKCDLLSQWPNPSSFRETQTTRIIIFLLKKMGIRALFSLVFFSLHIYFFFLTGRVFLKKYFFTFHLFSHRTSLPKKLFFLKMAQASDPGSHCAPVTHARPAKSQEPATARSHADV